MAAASVHFYKEDVRFRLSNKEALTQWILKAIRTEGFRPGSLNIIFCSDRHLRKMNKEYLQHDYNTDIITFDLTEDSSVVNGELYISTDRVQHNGVQYATGFRDELHRVIIHGVLHLCGYSDKSDHKQREMRRREDHFLSRRNWC
jgi:rRNA maturation RNase YbeY